MLGAARQISRRLLDHFDDAPKSLLTALKRQLLYQAFAQACAFASPLKLTFGEIFEYFF